MDPRMNDPKSRGNPANWLPGDIAQDGAGKDCVIIEVKKMKSLISANDGYDISWNGPGSGGNFYQDYVDGLGIHQGPWGYVARHMTLVKEVRTGVTTYPRNHPRNAMVGDVWKISNVEVTLTEVAIDKCPVGEVGCSAHLRWALSGGGHDGIHAILDGQVRGITFVRPGNAQTSSIKGVSKKQISDTPHKCPRCQAPAYVGFNSVSCTQRCDVVTR